MRTILLLSVAPLLSLACVPVTADVTDSVEPRASVSPDGGAHWTADLSPQQEADLRVALLDHLIALDDLDLADPAAAVRIGELEDELDRGMTHILEPSQLAGWRGERPDLAAKQAWMDSLSDVELHALAESLKSEDVGPGLYAPGPEDQNGRDPAWGQDGLVPYADWYEDAEHPPPFVLLGSTWSDTTLHFCMGSSTPDLSQAQVTAAMDNAARQWSSNSGISLLRTDCATADIVIDFGAGDHGDNSPFDGAGDGVRNVLAHAYPPPDGRVHFDEAETWSANGAGIDLETVALHELGHALGLDHSADRSAVMFASYGGIRRTLGQDDLNGIEALYGAPSWYCERGQDFSYEGWVYANAADIRATLARQALDNTTTWLSEYYNELGRTYADAGRYFSDLAISTSIEHAYHGYMYDYYGWYYTGLGEGYAATSCATYGLSDGCFAETWAANAQYPLYNGYLYEYYCYVGY